MQIKTARAYSSVADVKAKWPKYNFTDVVNNNLRNPGVDSVDILVMSAPTVDITNMDTAKLQSTENTWGLQEKAIESSKNMLTLAENSLKKYPNLSKVIIFEHPPRFDTIDVDPLSVKPTLARLANTTLGQLWLNSPLKHKIFIGQHSLESSGVGTAHFKRYQNSYTGRYDGVHLYGKSGCKDYTNSVKTILMIALPKYYPTNADTELGNTQSVKHANCEQTKYQKKQHFPSVQTRNRFDVLNQGNF